jgi:hypothetical protein
VRWFDSGRGHPLPNWQSETLVVVRPTIAVRDTPTYGFGIVDAEAAVAATG